MLDGPRTMSHKRLDFGSRKSDRPRHEPGRPVQDQSHRLHVLAHATTLARPRARTGAAIAARGIGSVMAQAGDLPMRADPRLAVRAQRLMRDASLREKVFEHLLLGRLGVEMMERGVDMTVLHAEVDRDGYDIVLVAGDVIRHVQLKVTIVGGARVDISVNTRLAAQPSGCVVWLSYDPALRDFSRIRWFGSRPGVVLPDPGTKVARHSRANSDGVKAYRAGHRVVAAKRFVQLDDVGHLADRLFGMVPTEPLAFLRSRLRHDDVDRSTWMADVADGDVTAIPADFAWDNATPFAGVINGYRLLKLISDDSPSDFLEHQRDAYKANGIWPDDAITLWTTFFLEVRADHFGANDFSSEVPHLDLLCRQLRQALIELEAAHG